MKTLCFVAMATCSILGSAAAAASPQHTRPSLTVMVYMNAKNDLDCDAIANVQKMTSALPLTNVEVVVELGRLPSGDGCAGEHPANRWSGTLFFKITKDLTPRPAQALTDVPDKPTSPTIGADVDMGDPKSLRKFVKWAEQNYPAKHYVLVIWGHGHGFRLLDAVSLLEGDSLKGQKVPPMFKTGYRAVSFDDTKQSYIFTHDFQAVLKGTPKLDVLAFDSCLMAGIETAYALRKLATVMVGSEELEPGAGWNYDKLLGRLSHLQNRAPQRLGTAFVEAVRANGNAPDNPVTLSAIDLRETTAVANQMSQLAQAMMAALRQLGNFDKMRSKISALRSRCKNYGQAEGFRNPIDLVHFVELLVNESPTPEIHVAAAQLLRLFRSRKVVFDNYASNKLERGFGSTGLTIYFPSDVDSYNNDPDDHGEGYCTCVCDQPEKHPVDFVCRERWSSFLRLYFGQE